MVLLNSSIVIFMQRGGTGINGVTTRRISPLLHPISIYSRGKKLLLVGGSEKEAEYFSSQRARGSRTPDSSFFGLRFSLSLTTTAATCIKPCLLQHMCACIHPKIYFPIPPSSSPSGTFSIWFLPGKYSKLFKHYSHKKSGKILIGKKNKEQLHQ